jgi:hypothetical protein
MSGSGSGFRGRSSRGRSLLFGLFIAAAIVKSASAMSALEFLRAEIDNKEVRVMQEIVIKLVSKGYRNVPDWARLSSLTKQKILEKGYTTQDVEDIAEEAAVGSGMTR